MKKREKLKDSGKQRRVFEGVKGVRGEIGDPFRLPSGSLLKPEARIIREFLEEEGS